jgi:hypothetical protein
VGADSGLSIATQLGLDPTHVYTVSGNQIQISLPVATGSSLKLGLRYESGNGPIDSAGRFRVIALSPSGAGLGGSTSVVRRE